MMAEEGFLCSDNGKNSIDDLKSCEDAIEVIQKINPDVSTTVTEKNFEDQPKGCFVMDNEIIFNTGSADLPNQGSRQVCKGNVLYRVWFLSKTRKL